MIGLCAGRLVFLPLPMRLATKVGCPGSETTTSIGETDRESVVIRRRLCSLTSDGVVSECDDHPQLTMTTRRVSLKMQALPLDQEVKGQLR